MKTLLAAASLLFCGLANAALIDNGTTTTDTQTGYVWMDLTQTTEFSYNQLQNDFLNPYSRFYGYKHASLSDLTTLWRNAGYVGDSYNPSEVSAAAILSLFNLFGQTGTDCCARADGRFDDGDGNGRPGFALIVPELNTIRVFNDFFLADQIGWTAANQMGSWIYKEQASADVPEPSGIALLGLGFLGLVASRKKAHSK